MIIYVRRGVINELMMNDVQERNKEGLRTASSSMRRQQGNG